MKTKIKFVLSQFKAGNWNLSEEGYRNLITDLGEYTGPWFSVFSRDHLYKKEGRVWVKNVGKARTCLENLLKLAEKNGNM